MSEFLDFLYAFSLFLSEYLANYQPPSPHRSGTAPSAKSPIPLVPNPAPSSPGPAVAGPSRAMLERDPVLALSHVRGSFVHEEEASWGGKTWHISVTGTPNEPTYTVLDLPCDCSVTASVKRTAAQLATTHRCT